MSLSVVRVGFGPPLGAGYVDYHAALTLQQRTHAGVVDGTEPDTVLLLEHDPVYTAGKRTNSWERPTDGTPVVDVDRGGRITWHGPGQIVGYPVTRLPDPIDVVAYVRRVEQVLIDVCSDLGIDTVRIDSRSGVWVPADAHGTDRKLGAIGVRVARGVTMHGFALNICNSLDAYNVIVPCGIADAGVTTLTLERERRGLAAVTVADVLPLIEMRLPALVSDTLVADAVVAR